MNLFYNALLFLPFFVSATGAITLLFRWTKSSRPQRIWTLFLFLMAACSFTWGSVFNEIQDYSLYYKLDVLDVTCTLLVFPLISLYFRALTHPAPFTWRQYSWLVPGLAVGAGVALLYLLMGEEQSIWFMRTAREQWSDPAFVAGTLPWWEYIFTWYAFTIVFFLQVVTVLIYSTVGLIRYRKELSCHFSNLDEKSIENSRAVLVGLYALLFLSLGGNILWSFFTEQYYFIRYLLMLITAMLIYYMTYHVCKIRFTIESINPEAAPLLLEEVSVATPDSLHNRFIPELIRLVDEEHIFLQPNLSVSDIARLLHSNRTYVSQMINAEFGCSFYDYINDKRIQFAQQMVRENPVLIQEQIAQASGFTHAATFSRVFKRQTGQTFREWQKSRS